MDNRVYYGEYSLRHWIELVLKKNLILPDYQRYFVWDERKVKKLIKTIKDQQFVPPITIGAFKSDGKNNNLILDGQQRITSILLAYLGLFPDAKTYERAIEQFASESDDDDEESLLDNVMEWNLNKLTKKGSEKNKILQEVIDGNYKRLECDIDNDFLDKNFLGFSYLVPDKSDEIQQQKYYSSVFRNINIQGETLLPQESRASLYYLDQELVNLFSPDFTDKIVINLLSNKAKADFVRYLSLLSQYYLNGNSHQVARGHKQKMEKLYEEYIYNAISGDSSSMFCSFLSVFPDKQYQDVLADLAEMVDTLEISGFYQSIIDVDVYLFGLTYQVIYKKEKIDSDRKTELMETLNRKINEFKKNESHKRSPNNLSHLRNRITDSIQIYGRYTVRES